MWRDIRKLPLAEQEAALRNPDIRRQMVEAARDRIRSGEQTAEKRNHGGLTSTGFSSSTSRCRHTVHSVRSRGSKTRMLIEVMIDLALEKHLKQFFQQPLVNEDQDVVLGMIRHPRSVVTFSDSGAHVSQIMDSSIQTHLLGYWVREKQALTLEQAVRKITFDLAAFWGMSGRGYLREGAIADVVVFATPRRSARKCQTWNMTCRLVRDGSNRRRMASWRQSSVARWCCAITITPGRCLVGCCGDRWLTYRSRIVDGGHKPSCARLFLSQSNRQERAGAARKLGASLDRPQ